MFEMLSGGVTKCCSVISRYPSGGITHNYLEGIQSLNSHDRLGRVGLRLVVCVMNLIAFTAELKALKKLFTANWFPLARTYRIL